MAILGNMILETCAAPTNAAVINLAGAVAYFSTFRSQIGNGEVPNYIIRNATQWEAVSGVLTHATPDTLARTMVLSNYLGTTSRVNFIGSVHVYPIVPAERAVIRDASNGVTIAGILNAGAVTTGGAISGASGTFSSNVTISGTATVATMASSGAVSGASGTFSGTVAATGVITGANGTASTQMVNFSQFNPTVSGGTVNTLLPGGVRWQSKSEVVTTDGSGNASVTFPSKFGTATPTVQLTNGNATTTTIVPSLIGTSDSAAQFNVPGWAGKSYTINWSAIGAA